MPAKGTALPSLVSHGPTRQFGRRLAVIFVLLGSQLGSVRAQFDDDEYQRGLAAHYQSSGNSARQVDLRVAFDRRTNTPLRLNTKGAVQVDWQGFLMSQAPGDYRLSALVEGQLEIELGGTSVLSVVAPTPRWFESELLPLEFDYHPITIRYQGHTESARVILYWSGPQFQLEPIGAKFLYHDPSQSPRLRSSQGEKLARALRCAACHDMGTVQSPLSAPDLTHLDGTLHRDWLIERLQSASRGGHFPDSKMPHFGLTLTQAESVADYLFANSTPPDVSPHQPQRDEAVKKRKSKAPDPVVAGKRLFLTVGCLACHSLDDTPPASGMFGGGELQRIAWKRPAAFFEVWLADPASVNPEHRMPVFSLTPLERKQLAVYLATLGPSRAARKSSAVNENAVGADGTSTEAPAGARHATGQALVEKWRCDACHRLPENRELERARTPISLAGEVDESVEGCLAAPDRSAGRPGYDLESSEREAVIQFLLADSQLGRRERSANVNAEQLLDELGCLSCHQRNGVGGLAGALTELAKSHGALSPLIPAMTPPALDQIGDKLHRTALQAALRREEQPYRDYLAVRMPRFRLDEVEEKQIVDYLVNTDRIPREAQDERPAQPTLDEFTRNSAGRRLVTADGFGCVSCHQIGSVRPSKAPLNARGPNLSMFGQRIRRSWFDRFVTNPARITPALEMPSVRVAVRGVLSDDLQMQLGAVWDVLNQSGFEPPEANPVRIVRHSGREAQDRALAVTDVVRISGQVFVKPLLIGFSNRHNVLFDLETASLARWSIGDTARQHTEGKTWYWEAAGNPVLEGSLVPDISVQIGDQWLEPERIGQFVTELDQLNHTEHGITFFHRLHFRDASAARHVLLVQQRLLPLTSGARRGFRRTVEIGQVPADGSVQLRCISTEQVDAFRVTGEGRRLERADGSIQIQLQGAGGATFNPDGSVMIEGGRDRVAVDIEYLSNLPVDWLVTPDVSSPAPDPARLSVVPGFESTRLPITSELMPTGLTWRPNGDLIISSLKGRVWIARDTDGDSLEDSLEPFSDELAAPYGVAATDGYVDVITKYALLRLFDDDDDGKVDRTQAVASGWGHTTDYHDWAAGLPRDPDGNYYVALPCQQDERSAAASHLRGTLLRLAPREPSLEDPRLFSLEHLTGGHRFPMGLALRSDGELFVTDNQGNYNPFNELNHIVPHRRFGFINAWERQSEFRPPLTAPAIDIPHPWTRSVNGICFLEAPSDRTGPGNLHFGPFHGHLLGCELDTQRLIRMTLQKVDGEFQGAAYPFSYNEPSDGPPLLGPLSCAVAPDGDLYIGGVRDSGWGGGNNIGELVRLRPRLDDLPCGIAKVRAVSDGLIIDFTTPVDVALASDASSYSLTTYTRVSTPAYGGDDQDRRRQSIDSVQVAEDRLSVRLTLSAMLAGHVYELHLKSLAGDGFEFFPAEAHYTMRRVPNESSPAGHVDE